MLQLMFRGWYDLKVSLFSFKNKDFSLWMGLVEHISKNLVYSVRVYSVGMVVPISDDCPRTL